MHPFQLSKNSPLPAKGVRLFLSHFIRSCQELRTRSLEQAYCGFYGKRELG
jgi:hypothetical protein